MAEHGETGKTGPLGGLIEPFIDGTLHDTWNYRDRGEERFPALYHEYNGFHELTQRDIKTRRIESYSEILNVQDTWDNLDEKMNAYFDDYINMFPYERRTLTGNTHVADLRIVNPENFFKIIIEMIQRRFPGGNDGKIGDQDMRDLTACLRVIYKEDLWALILRRRQSAFWSLLAGSLITVLCIVVAPLISIWSADLWPGPIPWGLGLLMAVPMATLATGVWFHRDFLANIKVKYESALKASASNLRNALHARLTEQVSLISQIMARINEEKWDLKSDNRLEDWPKMVTRWSKLAFWLSARVEAMEDFMQVQMWLIRRTHFGLRHIAGIITGLMRLGFLAATLIGTLLGIAGALAFSDRLNGLNQLATPLAALSSPAWFMTDCLYVFLVVANVLTGLVVIEAAQNYKLPEIELQDILQTSTMMGHKDTKLHDAIAALIKREKISILHGEDLSRGPPPR